MTHELKTWPEMFEALCEGRKLFEIRKNDRDFKLGDTLVLMEYYPDNKNFSGNMTTRTVGFVVYGPAFGVQEGYCVMSLSHES